MRMVVNWLGLGPTLAKAVDDYNKAADRLDAVVKEILAK